MGLCQPLRHARAVNAQMSANSADITKAVVIRGLRRRYRLPAAVGAGLERRELGTRWGRKVPSPCSRWVRCSPVRVRKALSASRSLYGRCRRTLSLKRLRGTFRWAKPSHVVRVAQSEILRIAWDHIRRAPASNRQSRRRVLAPVFSCQRCLAHPAGARRRLVAVASNRC